MCVLIFLMRYFSDGYLEVGVSAFALSSNPLRVTAGEEEA